MDEELQYAGFVRAMVHSWRMAVQTPRAGPAGSVPLGDDRQQRGFQVGRIGIEDGKPTEDLPPDRLAGKVGLLVPGPGAGRDSSGRQQDPGEITGTRRGRRAVGIGIGVGRRHLGS